MDGAIRVPPPPPGEGDRGRWGRRCASDRSPRGAKRDRDSLLRGELHDDLVGGEAVAHLGVDGDDAPVALGA